MTTFESSTVGVNKSAQELFVRFADMRNFEDFAPKDLNFKAEESNCSFNVPQAGLVELVVKERIPYSKITISQGNTSPIPFSLILYITDKNETKSEAQIIFHAEIPFMLKGMVSKPLQQFVDMLAERLKNL